MCANAHGPVVSCETRPHNFCSDGATLPHWRDESAQRIKGMPELTRMSIRFRLL